VSFINIIFILKADVTNIICTYAPRDLKQGNDCNELFLILIWYELFCYIIRAIFKGIVTCKMIANA
jgi:hypothetical protein